MSVLQAVYFDGKTSQGHPVSVMIAGGRLKVVGQDVSEEFDARGVRRSLRIANTPRWLYLPGGGACVTSDNDAVDRMTRDRRYEAILHRWESRPAYAVAAIAMVIAALWLLIDRVLPVAVNEIAARIPVEAEAALGRETLAGMERYFLQPSRLPASRQARLRERFDAAVRAGGEPAPYRLEFRASPVIGANAFALPSGIIVMTDELVKLARNDQEVIAVLAHELGHVRHRHTMRRLLESSATALIIAGVTGDIASTTSLAAAAPTLLLQTKYSRDHEHEADLFAIEMMRKSGIEPRYFAAILRRLEGEAPRRGGLPTFISSHPPTEEREALARGVGEIADANEDEARHAEGDTQGAPLPARPVLVAVDPVQRHVVELLEAGDYAALERLLGGYQQAFEADPGISAKLENAFLAFCKVPPGAERALNEWVGRHRASYVAWAARGSFHYFQGLEARGTGFIKDAPEENLQAMQDRFDKAEADLKRSLELTQKPYLSRLTLMSMARTLGNRRSEQAQYREAVKLAPQSVELRLAHMASLEPRWGGSLRQMEAFLAESRSELTHPESINRLAARIPAYRAHERQSAQQFEQALKLYDEAIALYASAGALCERSYVLSRLKRHGEAFADVRAALTKARDVRYCLEQAVAAAPAAGSAEEVIEVMTLVIEVDPASSHAFNRRGWRYQQQGRMDLAFQDYLASARLGDGWGQLMTGKLYWAGKGVKEDREEALVWLRKAAAQGHPDAKLSLQQALDQLGRR
jgi:Zn-dependent protease with chaperone function/tetratricopeptide (TPR) repeat protein